ncbi:unnamed protein product [Paramecium octaurelia]|uniref:Uncharacterized protein n=1 Tax=Paramecium octaurelia TaxID=43137 RepID=A0A8S1TI98_PAROT|nr:unnamed protein product [Paramecium octaurelia]
MQKCVFCRDPGEIQQIQNFSYATLKFLGRLNFLSSQYYLTNLLNSQAYASKLYFQPIKIQ